MIDDANNTNSGTDENIKTAAIIGNNIGQKEEGQKQEPTTLSMPKTKVNYNNEFMVVQPTTINYLILTVRPSSQKEKKESIKNMISKIGKKAKI